MRIDLLINHLKIVMMRLFSPAWSRSSGVILSNEAIHANILLGSIRLFCINLNLLTLDNMEKMDSTNSKCTSIVG